MKDGNWLALILWTLIYSICCGKLCFEIFLSVHGRVGQYSRGRLRDLTIADKIYDNFLGVSNDGHSASSESLQTRIEHEIDQSEPSTNFLSFVQNLK